MTGEQLVARGIHANTIGTRLNAIGIERNALSKMPTATSIKPIGIACETS